MTKLNYNQLASNFATRHGKEQMDSKPVSGALYLSMVAEEIHKKMEIVDRIQTTFNDVGVGNIMLECPDCGSPVLLEFKNCLFCDANLIGDTRPVVDAQTVGKTSGSPAPVSAPPEKKTRKTRSDKGTEVSRPDEPKEDVVVTEPVKAKETPKAAPKVESKLPTDKVIAESDIPTLRELEKSLSLAILPPPGAQKHTKASAYRAAFKVAVELLRKMEETVTPTKSEVPDKEAKPAKGSKGSDAALSGSGKADKVDNVSDMGSGKGKSKVKKGPKVVEITEEDLEPEVENDDPIDFSGATAELENEEVEEDVDTELDFDLDDVEAGDTDDAVEVEDDDSWDDED